KGQARGPAADDTDARANAGHGPSLLPYLFSDVDGGEPALRQWSHEATQGDIQRPGLLDHATPFRNFARHWSTRGPGCRSHVLRCRPVLTSKLREPSMRTIPRMGFIIPSMGIKKRTRRRPSPAGLADALFAKVQQRVLGVLFNNPHRSFYANEVIGLARSGTGAVQRELARLEASGLVTVTRVGKQKHYQANTKSPLF